MTTRSHRAYADTQRETSVSSAKPVELVAMVYQRLLDHLHTGQVQMREGADSSESFTKAIDLITTGLESCLDKEKGGEIAQNLAFIYEWAGKEILRARLRHDPEMIQGVINAFVPLAEAWLEHAGQKDDTLATKYFKPVKSSSERSIRVQASGLDSAMLAAAA
jgi:flagellar protein FliS